MSRLIDADALTEDCKRYLGTLNPDKDGKECTRIHWLIGVLENAPTIESEPQWIPCSERLPEEERKEYWICTDTGYQCECRWTNVNHFWTNLTTSWHWHIMDIPQYTKVVAWMPLPEPYKEEREPTMEEFMYGQDMGSPEDGSL